MLLEDVNELVAARVAAQAPQGLEHRQIGFAGAVLLHTLSATDAQGLHEADPGEKRFDQRRLPDPWLPVTKTSCRWRSIALPSSS